MAEERTTVSRRLRIFERAVWLKSSKYTTSGLITIVLGLVITILGVALAAGNYYSSKSLIIGLGVLILIIGIVRLLIGFINPIVPEDLPPAEPVLPEDVLTEDETF